jgi:hypothetical protein
MDFGQQLVGRAWQREVVITNQGRKVANLTWTNTKLETFLKTFSKSAKNTGGTCLVEALLKQFAL